MSQLSQVVSAAFKDFITEDGGKAYADLYFEFMGVRKPPPDLAGVDCTWIDEEDVLRSSSLAAVLERRVLYIGAMADHAPYYYLDGGTPTGFEYRLGNELARRIGAHYDRPDLVAGWCPVEVTTSGGGTETVEIFRQMNDRLQKGEFDLVMSGLLDTPDGGTYDDIDWACPTMLFYWSVIYTGRGDLGSALEAASDWTRAQFIDFLAKVRGALLVSTPGGPSQQTCEALRDEALAQGGLVFTATATIPNLGPTIFGQLADFTVGDAIAGAWQCNSPGSTARFLGIDVEGGEYFVKPFTTKGR